jgi:hypothetical protein
MDADEIVIRNRNGEIIPGYISILDYSPKETETFAADD